MYKIRGSDNNEYGPITADQVRQWIRENRLNQSSLVERVDAPGWKPLGQFPEFADALHLGGAGPVTASFTPAASDPVAAAARLRTPAILLIVFAVLGLLFTLAGPFMKAFWVDTMLGFFDSMNVPLQPEQRSQMEAAKTAGLGLQDIFGLALGLGVNAVMLVGALKMMKLQSWEGTLGHVQVALRRERADVGIDRLRHECAPVESETCSVGRPSPVDRHK